MIFLMANVCRMRWSFRVFAVVLFAGAVHTAGLSQSLPTAALPDELFLGDFEPPPANDTCETASLLLVSTVSTIGTTHDATPNYDSGTQCIASFAQPGPDVAYSVLLINGQSYTVTVEPEASYDASIYLVGPGSPSVCNATPLTCLAGADMGAEGQIDSFQFTPSQSGTYYVIVDSFYTGYLGSGSFSIKVTTP